MISANGPSEAHFTLHHDVWGRLVLTDAEGRIHVGVDPVRAFPITDPRRALALCDADGREVLWIDDLDAVAPAIRPLLEDELSRRHFLPVVQRVIRIEGAAEPTTWEVQTDRGPTTFTLKSEEDVRRVAGMRVLIVDAHGIRYLIPNLAGLDAASCRWLERYI